MLHHPGTHLALALGLTTALVAGCVSPLGSNGSSLVVRPGTNKTSTANKPATAASVLANVLVTVNAPSALASSGKLVSGDLASVIAAGGGNVIAAGGGNVIAAGGGNVIAAGGGNVIAVGGGNYRLLGASVDAYTLVDKAAVQLLDLNGQPVGAIAYTDAKGNVQFPEVKSEQPLLAVSIFSAGGKTYRMSVAIAAGKGEKQVYADPINTMVEARVRQVLAADGRLDALDAAKLKEVWGICNEANVQVKPEALETSNDPKNNKGVDELVKFYQDAVEQVVAYERQGDSSAKTPKADIIRAFMKSLSGQP